MSLISALLAFVVIPLKARPPEKTEREAKLEADVERLTFALDHWRNAGWALMDENERLVRDRDHWRAALNDRLRAERTAQQAACQQQAMTAQNVQLYQQYMQTRLQQDFQAFRNCVPSRSQVFDQGEE